MNRIDPKKRALVLALLVKGNTINGICRMLRVGRSNLLRFTGDACKAWHDEHFVNLKVEHLEIDEQWSYVHTHKERLSRSEKKTGSDKGDAWLWAAICRDSNAIISWDTRVANRDRETALELVGDTSGRITGRVAVTTDGLQSYQEGVRMSYGERATHAVEIKNFDKLSSGRAAKMTRPVDHLARTTREAVWGSPNLDDSTTSHIERFFLTIRQGNKRFARKTLANSKKGINHAAMLNLQIFIHNLCRKHEAIKTTPAVALGVEKRAWTLEEVVAMVDRHEAAKKEDAFEEAFRKQQWIAPKRRVKAYESQPRKTP